MTYQKLREDKTGPQFSLIKREGSEAGIEAIASGLVSFSQGPDFRCQRSVSDTSGDLTSHNRLKCTIQKKTWRQKIKTKANIGKRALP